MSPTPTGLAANWPVHVYDEKAQFFVWYTAPSVIVTQSRSDVLNMVFARRLIRATDAVRETYADEAKANGGFIILHDWSTIARYEGPARRELNVAWEKNVKPGDFKLVATQAQLNPIIRMAFNVINLSARAVGTEDHRLVKDLRPILAEFGVQPPRAGVKLPEVEHVLATMDDTLPL